MEDAVRFHEIIGYSLTLYRIHVYINFTYCERMDGNVKSFYKIILFNGESFHRLNHCLFEKSCIIIFINYNFRSYLVFK